MEGVSAAISGIRTVPYIIAVSKCNAPQRPSLVQLLTLQALGVIIAGQAISALGHAVPWMMFGAAVTTVGSGLIYTFNIGSPAKVWIGYQVRRFLAIMWLVINLALFQILGGIGVGLSFQVPIMVTQATTREQDVPLATAILLCKCRNDWVARKQLSDLLTLACSHSNPWRRLWCLSCAGRLSEYASEAASYHGTWCRPNVDPSRRGDTAQRYRAVRFVGWGVEGLLGWFQGDCDYCRCIRWCRIYQLVWIQVSKHPTDEEGGRSGLVEEFVSHI